MADTAVQGVNFPAPPPVVTVDVTRAPDRHHARKSYRHAEGRTFDPVLNGKRRTIIAHTGKSFGAPG